MGLVLGGVASFSLYVGQRNRRPSVAHSVDEIRMRASKIYLDEITLAKVPLRHIRDLTQIMT